MSMRRLDYEKVYRKLSEGPITAEELHRWARKAKLTNSRTISGYNLFAGAKVYALENGLPEPRRYFADIPGYKWINGDRKSHVIFYLGNYGMDEIKEMYLNTFRDDLERLWRRRMR